MKLSTLKLLIPMVGVSIQANSATTLIPPYLDHMQIPVAAIGSLISLAPIFALASRLPVGMFYHHSHARSLLSVAILAMGCTNYLYALATNSVIFGIVHALNGLFYGAVTTLYMAFFVDSLDADENRNHAIGYYVGSLAMGYSTGNFLGGLTADYWGYASTFQLGALLSFISVALLWLLHGPGYVGESKAKAKESAKLTARESLKVLLEPELA